MKKIILLLLVGYCVNSNGQKVGHQWTFSSINNFGYQIGDIKNSYSVQSINGIAYRDWAIGAGIGIDWYGIRSIPVFLDLRKSFLSGKQRPFLYAEAGTSIPWVNKEIRAAYSHYYKFKNTFYGEGGIGGQWHLWGKYTALLSAGYSIKKAVLKRKEETNQTHPLTDILPYFGPNSYDDKYQRLVVRIGFQL